MNNFDPYIIAEIGVNHEGCISLAKKMIEDIADAGGHAAKFQSYKAELLASINQSPAYWDLKEESCKSQFELFKKYDTFTVDHYKELALHCKKCSIDFMTTPFDLAIVDTIDPLLKTYKVASADITNVPLLEKIGKKKKNVILSTGASTEEEIQLAINILQKHGTPRISLLHCVLNYPTLSKNAQLFQIQNLKNKFGNICSIGYSDHTKPQNDGNMPALEMAIFYGATILEKHFTHNKNLQGNDHYHSMDSKDLAQFVKKLNIYKQMHGKEKKDLKNEEKALKNARRKIYSSTFIRKGELLSPDSLVPLRATEGIEISKWHQVLGKKAKKDIPPNYALTWDMI
jgi:sialic acid synthase SpsE